ncbi:MAG: 3-methyl-2-oxobutanoate dehydrogenase subunit VorB [Oscillospiraceae bacterium]|nr:3-methyl-2-oxobutanoate dehydrogenase subunit VorB [Oscillospiraceae bacterium]
MVQKMLMKGNEALAEAAIKAGCVHFFGYPITPQTEVAAYMSKRLPEVEGGVYVQAESEIASINMVLGAAASGVRAMTSSSSPGISLKTEGISYMAGCDLPCLIVNVQRAGPGLGGIQPSQADYWQATKGVGHGGAHILVFAPSSIQEMTDLVFDAFELAEKYRMPAMILSDGLLGQMMEPVSLPDREVVISDKPWAVTGHGHSRERNIVNSLYLQASDLEEKNNQRLKRYREVESKEARMQSYLLEDATIGVVAYGAAARVAGTAVDMARERGIRAGLMRPITLWPFPSAKIAECAAKGMKKILTVEMSDGQMVDDVRLAINGSIPVSFYGRTGGVVPTPLEIVSELEKCAGGDR